MFKKQMRQINQNLLAPIFFAIYKHTKSLKLIPVLRRVAKIQLKAEQIKRISLKLQACENCNFLVFGMGNDSKYWELTNASGRNYFIEDNEFWYGEMLKKNPTIKAVIVQYNTKRSQWKELLNDDTALILDLPEEITKQKWDIIFVDAPRGVLDSNPGRMKSIYTASKLIKKGGIVFVHDNHREVERVYSDKYLNKNNLVHEIGSLSEYIMP